MGSTTGIAHTVKDIREALSNTCEPNVYIKLPESQWPQRISRVQMHREYGLQVFSLKAYGWLTVEDTDVIYSTR